MARVLAVLGGEREGALARLDVGERAQAALGLRDDLVGDDEHVARAERRVEPRPAATSSAARSSPGADLRAGPAAASSVAAAQRVSGARGASRVEQRARARRAAERARARRAARRGRRACRRRARARAGGRPAPRAGGGGAPRGARTSRGRRRARSPSGGVDQQRVRPRAVAVGDDHDARRRGARQQRADLAPGPSARAVAGHEQHPLAPRASAARDAPAAAADWPASSGSWTAVAPAARALAARRLRGHDDHARRAPRTRPSASSTSPDHRARERARGRRPRPSPSRCLARPKDLTGRTASVRMRGRDLPPQRGGERRAPRAPRAAARPRRPSRRRSRASGRSLARSSRDQPVDQPRVVGADPVGVERMPGPGHEDVGRALEHRAARRAENGDDRRGASRSASRIPARARIGPIEITGFDGPITTARALAIASSTSGVAAAAAAPAHLDALDRPARPLADHELLEAEPRAARRGRACARARRSAAAPAPRTPSARQLGDRLGQPRALGQPPRALQADREVAVAEVEPDVVAELAQRRP